MDVFLTVLKAVKDVAITTAAGTAITTAAVTMAAFLTVLKAVKDIATTAQIPAVKDVAITTAAGTAIITAAGAAITTAAVTMAAFLTVLKAVKDIATTAQIPVMAICALCITQSWAWALKEGGLGLRLQKWWMEEIWVVKHLSCLPRETCRLLYCVVRGPPAYTSAAGG
ncbi:hypothetical protein MAPG_10793, partial [Magnaporthiopsis poae ATCC 64411]